MRLGATAEGLSGWARSPGCEHRTGFADFAFRAVPVEFASKILRTSAVLSQCDHIRMELNAHERQSAWIPSAVIAGDNRSVTTRKRLCQRSDYLARLILVLSPTCVAASITNFVAFKVGNFIETP